MNTKGNHEGLVTIASYLVRIEVRYLQEVAVFSTLICPVHYVSKDVNWE